MKSPRSLARVVCGGVSTAVGDLRVGADPLDEPPALHPVEQAAIAVDVVVLQVDQRDTGVGEGQVVASRGTPR